MFVAMHCHYAARLSHAMTSCSFSDVTSSYQSSSGVSILGLHVCTMPTGPVADRGLAEGRRDHGEHAEPKRGSGGGTQSGVQGQRPYGAKSGAKLP